MTVLAVDTSSRRRVLAVLVSDTGAVLASRSAARVEGLAVLLAELLAVEPPRAVVVAAGPGSYTGVRAGMAAAAGLAHAAGLPLHLVGSLDVVAHAAPAGATAILALADAGRGGLYAGLYRRDDGGVPRAAGEPRRVGAEALTLPEGAVAVALEPMPASLAIATAGGDGGAALAVAALVALGSPPAALAGLRPQHVDDTGWRAPEARV